MQFDQEKRGFSFSKEGPLDMRMDLSSSLTAKEIVNEWSEEKLALLFKEYGEERDWKRAAKGIIAARRKGPIVTTSQLSAIILSSVKKRRKIHPATLIFQALRIAVNRELESVQEGIKKALSFLHSGGRIGVISFHRLEDRIVKNIFRFAAKPLKNLQEVRDTQFLPAMKLLSKSPIVPTRREIKENRRSRSAKLRVAEKI